MAIPRASSGMLRSQIRPACRNAAPPLRPSAGAPRTMANIHGKDDLGGPGGQEPRPSKPAGPEAMKRNWYSTSASSNDFSEKDTTLLEPLVEEEGDADADARTEDLEALRDSRSSSTSSTSTSTSQSSSSETLPTQTTSNLSAQPHFQDEYVSFPKLTTPTS